MLLIRPSKIYLKKHFQKLANNKRANNKRASLNILFKELTVTLMALYLQHIQFHKLKCEFHKLVWSFREFSLTNF